MMKTAEGRRQGMTRQATSIRWTFVVLALMAAPALAQNAPPGGPGDQPMPGSVPRVGRQGAQQDGEEGNGELPGPVE